MCGCGMFPVNAAQSLVLLQWYKQSIKFDDRIDEHTSAEICEALSAPKVVGTHILVQKASLRCGSAREVEDIVVPLVAVQNNKCSTLRVALDSTVPTEMQMSYIKSVLVPALDVVLMHFGIDSASSNTYAG